MGELSVPAGQAARRWPWRLALGLGLALALAPLVLQMFTRGPGGAAMLADFEPYMKPEVIAEFQDYVATVDAGAQELQGKARFIAASRLGMPSTTFDSEYAALVQFEKDWPTARDDMGVLLDTIEANIGNYGSVAALPSFRLFPYFFVLPGLMIAAVAVVGLRRGRSGRSTRGPARGLAVLGVALIAAPLVFQMFSRAPDGEQMLDQFRPLMNTQRITTVQGYFVTMAGGEAAVRGQLLPALQKAGLDDAERRELLPASHAFTEVWTRMANQMAPMLAAMNDNLARYEGLIALPPFGLFPWFFVAPGVLLILLGLVSLRPGEPADVAHPLDPDDAADPLLVPALSKEK
ncbi:MAG: hypothetical protein ACLGI3_04125 [Actinomycetes bacterium]